MDDWDGQGHGQRWAPLADVAAAYGVSIDTVRRRMKRGELEARRQQTPQGFKWLALMPDVDESDTPEIAPNNSGPPQPAETSPPGAAVQVIERDREELIETLRHELALRNREVARLHEVIATQAKTIEVATAALPATTPPVEPPVPVSATGIGEVLENTDSHPETFWVRFRKWFSG